MFTKKVSPWVIVDGYAAARHLVGADPNDIRSRVALIEKTPRVRIRDARLRENFGTYEDGEKYNAYRWEEHLDWCYGDKGDDAFDEESRRWCDNMFDCAGVRTYMKPTKSMFATQEEWIRALAVWMEENPSLENQKKFMVFEGSEPTAENYMFEGDLLNFADMYFPAKDWYEVAVFATDNGYTLVIEDSERWEELGIMIDDADMAEEETFYDAEGNESPGGIYDAGGHANAERMAEWGDVIRDRRKYGE